ncbi:MULTISPECIES: LysE family translocator [Capnocytophaga]|uniref:Lysine transporter LysE n=1 Tax=Capnocytophaga canis TaxID=1848903 RepID=A0A0B7I793_9FLAO|nr:MULTISPECIES: LysE family transporter [Capnocytophaga]ATA72877.1 lysine transporter LysE [Capnocytophaga sp. H4358]ATA74970.1 lysine transporter LysE [Capnocytophaga sp. H2931]RIY35491.1 lysine transporter LysE [Capnocytophaga canis]CEN45748.1 Translocator protein, LysE family [Capnocytophaga canis]CEN50852.1 Translocator protein, LysE family [Capnocytophaga canis]
MFSDVLLALPLGVILAFTIGPVFFVLLETAITKGFRAAVAFDGGVILADIVFILVAYFTTSGLLQRVKDDPLLFIIGGLIMISYGLISYIKLKKDFHQKNKIESTDNNLSIKRVNYLALFMKGFLLNFINIGVLGFWLGIIIVFAPQLDMDTNRILVFFTSIVVIYFIIDILKILIAKQLKNKLTAFHIYKIKRTISIILLVFGVFLLAQGIFPESKEKLNEIFTENQ